MRNFSINIMKLIILIQWVFFYYATSFYKKDATVGLSLLNQLINPV